MEFLKRILKRVFNIFQYNEYDNYNLNKLCQCRRLLRLETLESRELLSGTSLLAEFGGYASTLGETEIRFELTNNNNNTSKIEITLNSLQAAFDPSSIRLTQTGGSQINLTNVFNTSTQSGGTALLAQGNYSIFFKSDTGAGDFNLKISFVESTPVPNINAMTIIAEAAKSQQMSGWTNRRDLFNLALYEVAPEYGKTAFNSGKVIDIFPEADVNKDGKIDNTDIQLAVSESGSNNKNKTTPQITKTENAVINPDKTPPTIIATLNVETQNGITTSPVISGKITDTSGIKSAAYKINNGSELQISLTNDGSFSILNNSYQKGKYNITIIVTDNYGNVSTCIIPEFTYQKLIITPPPETIIDNGKGTATIHSDFVIKKINNTDLTTNKQIILNDNNGIITINNNIVTLIAGTKYDYLAKDEKTNLTISVQLADIYGKTYDSEIEFTIVGINNEPQLINNEIISCEINELYTGKIDVNEILNHWNDVDLQSTIYVVDSSVTVKSILYSDDNLKSIFAEDFIKSCFNTDQNGNFVFDATYSSFAQLSEDETITIEICYYVSDTIDQNSGTANFIVKGNKSEIKLETENDKTTIDAGFSNDRNTQKEIDFNFRYENPDAKNETYKFQFSDIKVNNSSISVDDGLIVDFDESTGKFKVDTSKLSNREEYTKISIKISVVCGENIISRDVNITLKALEKPTADDISIEVNENDNSTNDKITVTKTSGNNDVTFDELEFVSAEKNNINNINLAAYGIDDLSKIAQLENNGNFTFNPSTYFISMSGNETITLKLKYTITDNEYGNSGFGYIFVTIKGQATPPINPDEQLKIDNSDDINYEPQQTITVTKNEILTNWELPENADNYKISSVGNITYETGFDGENNFATNPFENNSLGSAEIDSDGNIVFTPDETIAKTLSNGQWIEIKIEYSLQNIHDANGENLRSSSIIIKITGQNEKPEFNEIPFLEIEDSEILEIQWENYFQDIDLNDTLKITKINDQPFDENNAIIINDVGKFYFDNGKLLFSPAEKFKSLKKDSSEKLTLNFTVEDSSLATATGDFEINVIGTNKAPQAENQEKTIENGENITFKLDNISDLNDGDQHKIDNIEIKISERESIILDQNTTDHTVTLDNGIVITFNVTENTITLDTAQRSKLPDDGKPEKIELVVTISDDSGETCISNWSTIITNKPPQIENELSYTYIYKVEDTGSYKIDLTENINDLNIPNRDQQNDTWEISDLKILDEIDNELKNTIQNSLELENNDLTFKPSSDLLEYLKTNIGEGKTFEIQLSYLVTDKLLTDSNGDNLSTEGKLILQIYGKKAAEIEVENMKIDLAKLQSDSQVTVSDQSEITISDPDKILNANDYNIAIDYDSIQISGTQQTNFDSFNFESVFKIDSTDSTTNKIQFTDNADMFAPLNAGEKLMFTFNIVVTDSYGTTATKPVTITIIGKGDPAVVTTSDNLTIWSNKRNNNSEVHDVNYEIDDPDYGENHTYSFGGLQNSDSENIPLQDDDNVISVDNTNGKITFNENFFDLEFLKNLTGDSVFTILINIRGGNDQLINQAELKLNIKVAKSPEIKIEHQEIDANKKIENLQISVIDNNTGTLPESDNYSYSKPVLAENINISDEIKNKIDATINEKGQFNFNPDNIFDYLSKNKSITLTFNFTVTDKIYNVESGSSIIVTINGVNEKPIFNDIQTINAGQITFDENNNGIEIILSELFSDADKNDKHKVVSINDVTITNDWTTVKDLGQFKYTETDENGFDGKLFYRAFVPLNENNELEKLSEKLNELNFTIKIQDNSNENNNTSEGEIKIAVIGANSQPVINKNKIDDTIDENTISEKYLLRDFITDKNINDDFTFNTINGEQILTPSDNSAETQTIVISDGTKIIVSSDRKSFQIDATSRYENLQPNKIVLNSILVTISDNSQTENAISPPCSIQFKIKGINDPPQLNDQHFGINLNDLNSADSSGTKKYIGTISITDIDTVTENYNFTISPENENGNENTTPSIELKNEKNGVSIYIDENDIPSLEGDESVSYKFKITAATSDGETANAQIIITFSNKPKLQVEFVDNDDNLIISESETETETLEKEVRVTSNNEETAAADYSYTNVRFVEGTIQNDNQPNNNQSNNNQSTEQIFVLPQGVEFGFDSDKFYIKPNGKFDFLGDNEKITLIFEFTVFDNINYIGTSQRINVTINGENSAPVANDAKAEVDIPINNTTGYKFYLTDLFADIDRNDSINEIFVNNTKFTIAGNVKDIYQDNIKYGTIKFDSINQCLIFIPDSDFPIRSNEIYLLKFQIAVTDQSGIKSNSGEITIGLRGVNKPPKFNDNINLITNENEKLIINAAEIANDSNGDPLKIISVTDGNETIEINGNSKTITLQSGAVLTLTESGQLIYDPINRTNNLSKDKSDKETIRLIIADEYENGTSHTDWKTLEITVKGVNDNPVDIKSEQTEIIGNLKGEEQKIKLSEYFNDPDNDILSYEILNTIDNNSFVENWKIEGIENEFYLVIKFKSDYYSDNIQFNSAELNLQVKDSNGGEIKKTFIVKLPPTVKLDINTDDNIEDDTYTVTVTAFDLINELLGYSYSNGFTSIKFSINFNPELCEIVENSISAAGEIKDFGYAIFVEITADQIAEMMTSADTNLSNLTLISFKVKSISSGAAEFSIGNYLEIFRNNNLISNSQIACSNNTTTQ